MDIATSQKRVCDMGLGKGICQALGRVKWVGQSLSAKLESMGPSRADGPRGGGTAANLIRHTATWP